MTHCCCLFKWCQGLLWPDCSCFCGISISTTGYSNWPNLRHVWDNPASIQMAFGDSDCLFTGTATQTPLQGVGQENGAGPQICAAVSSPIFDMVCNSGHGSTLQSFLTQGMVKFVGFGFVDDADLMQWTTLLPEPLQAFSINYNKPLIYGKWDFKHLAVLYWLKKANVPFSISIGKRPMGIQIQTRTSWNTFDEWYIRISNSTRPVRTSQSQMVFRYLNLSRWQSCSQVTILQRTNPLLGLPNCPQQGTSTYHLAQLQNCAIEESGISPYGHYLFPHQMWWYSPPISPDSATSSQC